MSQFIVNEGIIYNKRDMMRLLRDLGHIFYHEVVKGKAKNHGKGYIMRVCSNSEEPTLFLNGRIYINVNAFDYLQLKTAEEKTIYELFSEERVIKVVPDDRPQPIEMPPRRDFFHLDSPEEIILEDLEDSEDFPGIGWGSN